MKHSFFFFTPSGNTRVIALLQSPMNAVGMTIPVIASAAPKHICTDSLIPTERNARAAGNKRYLCKISFLRLIRPQPKPQTLRVWPFFSSTG